MTWQGGGGLGAPFHPPIYTSPFSSGHGARRCTPPPLLALPQSGATHPCSEKHGAPALRSTGRYRVM